MRPFLALRDHREGQRVTSVLPARPEARFLDAVQNAVELDRVLAAGQVEPAPTALAIAAALAVRAAGNAEDIALLVYRVVALDVEIGRIVEVLPVNSPLLQRWLWFGSREVSTPRSIYRKVIELEHAVVAFGADADDPEVLGFAGSARAPALEQELVERHDNLGPLPLGRREIRAVERDVARPDGEVLKVELLEPGVVDLHGHRAIPPARLDLGVVQGKFAGRRAFRLLRMDGARQFRPVA